jgi:hypothetical protein
VKALAPLHPEWKDKEPFASLLKGDLKGALAGGEAAIFEIVTVTHSGMTTDEFEKIVRDWITTAHRNGLSADAGTARLSARQRLQDFHRLRWRHRLHAGFRRESLWRELHRAGLLDKVDGGFEPHNREGRQYKSDNSTERVKRFRERKSAVALAVTETPPEQSRTETKQNRADPPRAVQVDLVEAALRADLQEVLGGHVDLSRVAEWLGKGYDPGMIREVVRDLRCGKPDFASLAYFDAALADRHAKRAETPSERAGYAAVTDFDKVIAMFVRTGVWSRYAGPEPGMLGCRAPLELLAKHGIDATTGDKMRKAG